jgi:hypothetical protein
MPRIGKIFIYSFIKSLKMWMRTCLDPKFSFWLWNESDHSFRSFSLAGEIAHPFEFFLNFLLPTILPPLLAGLYHGVHVVTLWLWLFFRSLRSTEAHSGYVLPWYLWRFFPLFTHFHFSYLPQNTQKFGIFYSFHT